jgi:tRNA-specific 2-thiouridylase
MVGHGTERVVVGMSGGVDSSVAALLLARRGYDVHGLFMTNWEEDEDGYCNAARDLQDARAVARQLGIPLNRVNFAREYRERVFAYLLAECDAGRTPNPDVLCNREIKFGVFQRYARRLGARWMATGHYARTDRAGRLLRAADEDKDQTYFLQRVTAPALRETLFPLGALEKGAVRRIADEAGLPNHAKPDSTGICFIGERRFREFLARYLPARPGPIVAGNGERLGEHAGLMFYTIGQRQGLGIGGRKGASPCPWYVAEKDLARNRLVVVQGHDHPRLLSRELLALDPHWIRGQPPVWPLTCRARTRHRQALQACRVEPSGAGLRVWFETPQRAITPGQFVAFYDGQECLGGAVIQAARSSAGAATAPAATTAPAA